MVMNMTEACITQNSTLCSLHFQKENFYGSFETRICLKEDAIPFVKLLKIRLIN